MQDRVAELQAARVQLLKVTQDQVVREFAKLAFVNMQDFITVQADGSAYTDLSKLTRDQAVAIQEITVDQYTESRGDAARNVKRLKIKLADKQGAEPRELLMPPTEASVDWYTPEVLAQKLLIFTDGNFSEAEMLPYAHAMMDLPDGDPRRDHPAWHIP